MVRQVARQRIISDASKPVELWIPSPQLRRRLFAYPVYESSVTGQSRRASAQMAGRDAAYVQRQAGKQPVGRKSRALRAHMPEKKSLRRSGCGLADRWVWDGARISCLRVE